MVVHTKEPGVMLNVQRAVVASVLLLAAMFCSPCAQAGEPGTIIVERAARLINAQLRPAKVAVDRATIAECRVMIILAITGASDAQILAYNAGTLHRLSDAAADPSVAAQLICDDALLALHDIYEPVPSTFTEAMGRAILVFHGRVLTHIRDRTVQTYALAAWLTR
jgi:hypothetical protein